MYADDTIVYLPNTKSAHLSKTSFSKWDVLEYFIVKWLSYIFTGSLNVILRAVIAII